MLRVDRDFYLDVAAALLPPSDLEFLRRTLRQGIFFDMAVQLSRLIERGYPIQYLLGREMFLGYEFLVFPGVFIPREETEKLVEIASKLIPSGAYVLDVGSGTGAIGVSLSKLRTDVSVDFCDMAWPARFNTYVNAYRLIGRGRVFQCDMSSYVPRDYDVIISNPPYVPVAELTHPLTYWEPQNAIFGGKDGTLLLAQAIAHWGRIHRVGMVFLEVDEGEVEIVSDTLKKSGFRRVDVYNDQFGVGRFMTAWR